MAMTNKSLLGQYKAAVKAVNDFAAQDKDDPHWTRWMKQVRHDALEIEHTLGLEIRKRGLKLPKV